MESLNGEFILFDLSLSLFLSFIDSSDSAPGCSCIPFVLDAPPHHRHVGGVWRLPPERRLLRIPHRVALPGLRQLLRQPHPLRLPVGELPEGMPTGLHLHPLLSPPTREENSTNQDGELLHHALHHGRVRKTPDPRAPMSPTVLNLSRGLSFKTKS